MSEGVCRTGYTSHAGRTYLVSVGRYVGPTRTFTGSLQTDQQAISAYHCSIIPLRDAEILLKLLR